MTYDFYQRGEEFADMHEVAVNDVPDFKPIRVNFWEYNNDGEMTLYTGLAVAEFTDPEDYRSSYNVKIDEECAEYNNQHMTPYTSECKEI